MRETPVVTALGSRNANRLLYSLLGVYCSPFNAFNLVSLCLYIDTKETRNKLSVGKPSSLSGLFTCPWCTDHMRSVVASEALFGCRAQRPAARSLGNCIRRLLLPTKDSVPRPGAPVCLAKTTEIPKTYPKPLTRLAGEILARAAYTQINKLTRPQQIGKTCTGAVGTATCGSSYKKCGTG